jgi:hypothetical protein
VLGPRGPRVAALLAIVVGVLALSSCLGGSSQAKDDAKAHLSTWAGKVAARDGKVVTETFGGGGLDGPYTLGITLRDGDPMQVAMAALQSAVAAGYQGSPQPPCLEGRGCGFTTPATNPGYSLETFSSGSTVRGTDITVPAGKTAVVVTLVDHPSSG